MADKTSNTNTPKLNSSESSVVAPALESISHHSSGKNLNIPPEDSFPKIDRILTVDEDDDILPKYWNKFFDEKYQTFYYVNSRTGKTQWERPSHSIRDSFFMPLGDVDESEHFDEPSSQEGKSGEIGETIAIPNGDEELKVHPDLVKKFTYNQKVKIEWLGSEDFTNLHDDRALQVSGNNSPPSIPHLGGIEEAESESIFEKSTKEIRIDNKKRRELIGGKNLDYFAIAKAYKEQRPYSNPNYKALCILCHKNYSEDVFFPCEHHCVCRECMLNEKICEEGMLNAIPDAYVNCSLCGNVIKLVLPLENGKEVKQYWDWVYEERVMLPRGFMRKWRQSANAIKHIYNSEGEIDTRSSMFCSIS